ncbi:hypothetical protein BDP55DRAFT_3556 [Colletotrichum godetiae]|uniref:Uncharacterized protein n=1 Tax=Colletotrichum godetiae TaxID=1209918 RepID=A0AAJ0B1W5_9PEZI|nr:uncharacterized protein BDP55DRAFT_3556 [Colletotrichum godetiae]KAK1700930.1 hypothetical protein BDP55DRAFT_3556 [Colletotrichum godetiae]
MYPHQHLDATPPNRKRKEQTNTVGPRITDKTSPGGPKLPSASSSSLPVFPSSKTPALSSTCSVHASRRTCQDLLSLYLSKSFGLRVSSRLFRRVSAGRIFFETATLGCDGDVMSLYGYGGRLQWLWKYGYLLRIPFAFPQIYRGSNLFCFSCSSQKAANIRPRGYQDYWLPVCHSHSRLNMPDERSIKSILQLPCCLHRLAFALAAVSSGTVRGAGNMPSKTGIA